MLLPLKRCYAKQPAPSAALCPAAAANLAAASCAVRQPHSPLLQTTHLYVKVACPIIQVPCIVHSRMPLLLHTRMHAMRAVLSAAPVSCLAAAFCAMHPPHFSLLQTSHLYVEVACPVVKIPSIVHTQRHVHAG